MHAIFLIGFFPFLNIKEFSFPFFFFFFLFFFFFPGSDWHSQVSVFGLFSIMSRYCSYVKTNYYYKILSFLTDTFNIMSRYCSSVKCGIFLFFSFFLSFLADTFKLVFWVVWCNEFIYMYKLIWFFFSFHNNATPFLSHASKCVFWVVL